MKRPLCLIAICIFVIQVFALFVPQQAYLPIAAVFSCAFLLSFKAIKKRRLYFISIILAAVSFALIWRVGYNLFTVNPALALIGTKSHITAIIDKANIFDNGNMSAELTVANADTEALKGKRVFAVNMPRAEEGSTVKLVAELESLTPSQAKMSNSHGIFISAKYLSGFEALQERSLYSLLPSFKYKLSQSFKLLTSEKAGIIGAAMAFGDKSLLTDDIKDGFRAAGLSHMLVVSGMHLAAFSGLIFAICGSFVKNRRIKAVISIVFTILFILLTGVTPSSIRAGVMLCIIYAGMCFWRQADTITSLSIALVVLTLQNPYIAMDMGFLLSFAATAGIVAGNTFIKYLQEKSVIKNKILLNICKVIAIPLSASLATAPVLISFGVGISIAGLLLNIIAVPLLPFIVAFTFAASLLNFIPWLYYAAKLAAFIASALIGAVSLIANAALLLPFSIIYLKGTAMAAVLPFAAFLAYLGAKFRVKYSFLLITIFIVLSFSLIALLNLNVVHVSAVTNAQNAPLVIYKNGKGSIIFRAKPKVDRYFVSFLKRNNIKTIELVVLLDDFELDENFELLNLQKLINVKDFSFTSTSYILNDIIIDLKKQENSCAAFINAGGILLYMNRGIYDFSGAENANIYIAGQSRAENISADVFFVNNSVPKWLMHTDNIYTLSADAEIAIRNGVSYKLYEGYYELN